MKFDKKSLLLYAVTDRSWSENDSLKSQVKKSLDGGVTFVQLREKELDHDSFLAEALEIKALCKEYGVPFVINDNVALAKEVDADGVHVGQGDMEIGAVRALLGSDKIVGVSAQTVQQALSAQTHGADYLGVGAVFPTNSKRDAEHVDVNALKDICAAVHIPVVAIGGIGLHNVTVLANSGICGIAVISAIFAQPNVEAAAKELRHLAERVVERS